jgi:hypothetical protein
MGIKFASLYLRIFLPSQFVPEEKKYPLHRTAYSPSSAVASLRRAILSGSAFRCGEHAQVVPKLWQAAQQPSEPGKILLFMPVCAALSMSASWRFHVWRVQYLQ